MPYTIDDLRLIATAFAGALILAALLAPRINRLIVSSGWVDTPSLRKNHVGSIPLSGGTLIMTVSLALSLLLTDYRPELLGLAVGALGVFAIGFVDDRVPVRARYRFIIQILACMVAICVGGTQLNHLGDLFGSGRFVLGVLAVPFTLFAMAGVINATNMSDGADGLAGGLSTIALFWFFCALATSNAADDGHGAAALAIVVAALIGSLLVFLAYNLRTPWRDRAAIFMGDGGSMMLGFILAWLAVRTTNHMGEGSLSPVAAVWFLAMPLFDAVSCMIRRLGERFKPMTPDHKHMHHLVFALGFSVRRGIALMLSAAFCMGLIGYVGWLLAVPDVWMLLLLAALFVTYHSFAIRTWARLGLLGKRVHETVQISAARQGPTTERLT